MSTYSLLAFAGNGFGALVGGWTEANPKLEWRWIQWIHLVFVDLPCFRHIIFLKGPFFSVTGVYLLVVTLVVKETRASVTLAKLAEKLRKETGDIRYQPFLPELERHSLRQMIYISCTRPVCGSDHDILSLLIIKSLMKTCS